MTGKSSAASRIRRGAALAGMLFMLSPIAGWSTGTATLVMEQEALDLETGSVTGVDMGVSEVIDGADVYVAFNAERAMHAVVAATGASTTGFAVVTDTAFDGVTTESLAGLSFDSTPADLAFTPDITIVVRTGTGAVFKLGNTVEDGTTVTFNYAQIQ